MQRKSDFIVSRDEGETKKIYVLPHQKPVVECGKRIVVAIGGVQSGKTIASLMGLARILAANPGETCFLLAPVFHQLESATLPKMRKVLSSYGLYDRTDSNAWNKSRHILFLNNGAKLRYMSASNPEYLQGVTTPGVMIDEISQVEERILDIALERVAVLEGTVYLSGLIPHPGQLIGHWIYDRVYKPYQEGDKDIEMFTFSSQDNPFFPQERFEKAKEEMPDDLFAAEYKGEFRETTLSDNVFIPSSIDFSQRRWLHRIKYLPANLYNWVDQQITHTSLPEHEGEDIAKAQGSYIREQPDKKENKDLFIAFNKFRTRFGQERHYNDDEKKDYEQDDPEAGLIKYSLEEETDPLLLGVDYGDSLRKIIIGVDVADEGGDLTVATARWHNTVLAQKGWVASTDRSVDILVDLAEAFESRGYEVVFWIDAPGLGKPVINQLRNKENKFCQEFWPSDKPPEEPKRYTNIKAWLFFEVRDKLLQGIEAIPSNDDLRRQLFAQKFGSTSHSKLKIKKNKNRSPDYADSYVISTMPTLAGMNPAENVFFF